MSRFGQRSIAARSTCGARHERRQYLPAAVPAVPRSVDFRKPSSPAAYSREGSGGAAGVFNPRLPQLDPHARSTLRRRAVALASEIGSEVACTVPAPANRHYRRSIRTTEACTRARASTPAALCVSGPTGHIPPCVCGYKSVGCLWIEVP